MYIARMAAKDPELVTVGTVLRSLRDARDLTQEQVAGRSRLDRTYVGGVERGERNLSFKSLSRILRALGVQWPEFAAALQAQLAAHDSKTEAK